MKWTVIKAPYLTNFGESSARAYATRVWRYIHGQEVMLWRIDDKWWIFPISYPHDDFVRIYAGENLETAKTLFILLTDSEA